MPYISSDEEEQELPTLPDGWGYCTSPSCPRHKQNAERHEFWLQGESPDLSYGNIVRGTWKDIQLGTSDFEADNYIDVLDEIMDHEFMDKVTNTVLFFILISIVVQVRY